MEYVLITGATSGIGYEIASIYAANHYGLVIVSSNEDHLKDTKEKLEREFQVSVHAFVQNLAVQNAAENVYQYVKKENIIVSVLVNNAGYGLVGETHEIELRQDIDMITVNVESLVSLCKLFIPQMIENKKGKILNVASTGAFQPGPFTSTYFASKAFVLSYSKAIRYELKTKGIHVTTLCPGATKTNFFSREKTKIPAGAMSPKVVAALAIKGLDCNKEVVIPGAVNRLIRMLPQRLKMLAVAGMKGK